MSEEPIGTFGTRGVGDSFRGTYIDTWAGLGTNHPPSFFGRKVRRSKGLRRIVHEELGNIRQLCREFGCMYSPLFTYPDPDYVGYRLRFAATPDTTYARTLYRY